MFYQQFGTGAPGFNRNRGVNFPSIAVDRTKRPAPRPHLRRLAGGVPLPGRGPAAGGRHDGDRDGAQQLRGHGHAVHGGPDAARARSRTRISTQDLDYYSFGLDGRPERRLLHLADTHEHCAGRCASSRPTAYSACASAATPTAPRPPHGSRTTRSRRRSPARSSCAWAPPRCCSRSTTRSSPRPWCTAASAAATSATAS